MGWRFGKIIAYTQGHLTVASGPDTLTGTPARPLPARCEGRVVMVELAGGAICKAHLPSSPSTTPVPSTEDLTGSYIGPRGLAQPRRSSSGDFTVDSRGRACELGWITELEPSDSASTRPHRRRVRVLNLTGHKLDQMNLPSLQVHAYEVNGAPWLVLAADAPLHPKPERPERPARIPLPRSRPPRASPDQWTAPPSPLKRPQPQPVPTQIDQQVAARDVVWLDGSIDAKVPPLGTLRLPLATARAGLEELKAFLPFKPPLTLHIHGTVPPGCPADAIASHLAVHPSEPIESAFVLAGEQRLIHCADTTTNWSPLPTVAGWAGLPSGGGLALITSQPFGMHQRKEAFRRLYEHRVPHLQPILWKRTMMLFPIQLPTWPRHVWVWETPNPDRASYIFAPTTPDTLNHVKATLSDPNFARKPFLADRQAHTATAFVGRTFHRGTLDDWWLKLCRKASNALR